MVAPRLIILGRTPNDKGRQLEQLTQRLLASKGYRNIITNYRGAGGEEVDIRADLVLPGLGDEVHRLICECKAHADPSDMTDWQKFLGKVYTERAGSPDSVRGSFIALSGIKGTVAGNYAHVRRHDRSIELITGDDLSELVGAVYEVAAGQQVQLSVQNLSNRHYWTLDRVYYDDRVYLLLLFDDETYTLLDAKANPLSQGRLEVLLPLLGSTVEGRSYADLRQEDEARRRASRVQQAVISQLMLDGGTSISSGLLSDSAEYSQSEVEQAVNSLREKGWLLLSEDQTNVSLAFLEPDVSYALVAEVYEFLLTGEVSPDVIGCPFYDSYINQGLLAEIQRIQGGFPLPPDDVNEALQLLRWSPIGLAHALRPDPMLVQHRTGDTTPDTDMDRLDRNYFFGMLYSSLARDFRDWALGKYLHEIRGLREIEVSRVVTVKSESAVVLEGASSERIRVGKMRDEEGGMYISALLFDTAPQPWDPFPAQEGDREGAHEQEAG